MMKQDNRHLWSKHAFPILSVNKGTLCRTGLSCEVCFCYNILLLKEEFI